ncbi:VOC family protein [Patulibacter defluvii]|uniref:VOC family protein n=1 Tax=Patulibacter defluvii TaxID=3095358 RepID=UPI002A757351|nr:VOC family protein [Patulibacter sp. DM4]
MINRIGHIALRVADLDAAVGFQQEVIGMVESERLAGVSYLTCNDRHHELILIEDPLRRGYDHIALEVDDPADLEAIAGRVARFGGRVLGDVYEGEPGIDRAIRIASAEGHVFKLFHGMRRVAAPPAGDRPRKFEHVSVKVRRPGRFERFLRDGLGLRFSDRMGPFASWWHADADHHGIAVVWSPTAALSHYAYAWPDLNALGRVADRLAQRDRKLIWGPSRHGPGNNHFAYHHDEDGAMIEHCSELAQMPPVGDYQPRRWRWDPTTINQWGGPPPARFLLTGYPIVPPEPGRPSWAIGPGDEPSPPAAD